MKISSFGFLALGAAGLGIAGCTSDQGLSSRENGMQSYAEIVLPAPAPVDRIKRAPGEAFEGVEASSLAWPTTGPAHVHLPARVSVVQIGEISPPDSMLAKLRSRSDFFSVVNPQSGVFDRNANVDLHDRLNRMRLMASNLGSEYLLVFGGDIESGQQETGLAVFNLTIVGALVVPSTGVAVSGKAAGSLIDVNSGRVLMNFSSDTKGGGLAPTAFARNAETVAIDNAKTNLVQELTDDVIKQLGENTKASVAIAK